MGFENAFKEYVSQVQTFVETMHSGLLSLTESEATQSIAAALKTPKKILVVDELEINRVLFGRYFHGLPFEITFAKTPDEAEQKIAAQSFDLVLRDWKDCLAQGLSKQAVIEKVIARIIEPV